MNIWENTVLTDKGKALQAKLLSGQTLKIKRVTTGAKKVPVVDLRQQLDVTEGGYDITLQPTRTDGEKMIIPVFLENKGLKESYELWQVGFYAEDPDEGEILFCLAQAAQAKNIPSEKESPGFSITWDFYFDISNTVPFEVVLNSAGLVNIEAYQVHTEAIQQTNTRLNSLNSDLDTTKSTLNSYISTHKIQKTTVRNYAIGTGLSITPSSNSRLALITPTFGNINSFAYNVQILPVVPNSNTLTIQWLAKNDGTIVRSGNVDLEIMLFPWE